MVIFHSYVSLPEATWVNSIRENAAIHLDMKAITITSKSPRQVMNIWRSLAKPWAIQVGIQPTNQRTNQGDMLDMLVIGDHHAILRVENRHVWNHNQIDMMNSCRVQYNISPYNISIDLLLSSHGFHRWDAKTSRRSMRPRCLVGPSEKLIERWKMLDFCSWY